MLCGPSVIRRSFPQSGLLQFQHSMSCYGSGTMPRGRQGAVSARCSGRGGAYAFPY